MKNKILLSLLLLTCMCVNAYAQDDVAQLTERIIKLEQNFKWLGVSSLVGILGLGATLFGYMSILVKRRANTLLEEKFKAHPFFAQYQREQKAKGKKIMIIGNTSKDKAFVDFLEDDNYNNTHSFAIDDISEINTNDYKLLLINNEHGQFDKEQETKMYQLANKYHNKMSVFYYCTNKRFDNKQMKNGNIANYANSRGTLIYRLLETLR